MKKTKHIDDIALLRENVVKRTPKAGRRRIPQGRREVNTKDCKTKNSSGEMWYEERQKLDDADLLKYRNVKETLKAAQ